MNRADLQKLSNARIREAKILFAAGEYSGAYYLAGYAVECALKACFAKGIRRHDFPDKNRTGKVFIHKLRELAQLANVDADLAVATKFNTKLDGNWLLACNWTEESRYSTWTQNDAEAMIEAISGKRDGVLPWIKRRW
ncbi:HEPN domain-containing protein [Granulicella sp. L60]|jgi:HEPN domain-containing protein|uniref:HEPN domain-containing protein n=1 Tax=Granulicella sp. L60 TaxID=1641866 RepID=UPI00131D8F96|nr:HEPN domain-containing protein [Granulicella sp. L60]